METPVSKTKCLFNKIKFLYESQRKFHLKYIFLVWLLLLTLWLKGFVCGIAARMNFFPPSHSRQKNISIYFFIYIPDKHNDVTCKTTFRLPLCAYINVKESRENNMSKNCNRNVPNDRRCPVRAWNPRGDQTISGTFRYA